MIVSSNDFIKLNFVFLPQGNITSEIPKIFDAVFECTLHMIDKNFEEFPEHRTNFFLLLQAVNSHCFSALLNIPPRQFKLVLDSIIWAVKHTMRNVADTGMVIVNILISGRVDQTVGLLKVAEMPVSGNFLISVNFARNFFISGNFSCIKNMKIYFARKFLSIQEILTITPLK